MNCNNYLWLMFFGIMGSLNHTVMSHSRDVAGDALRNGMMGGYQSR